MRWNLRVATIALLMSVAWLGAGCGDSAEGFDGDAAGVTDIVADTSFMADIVSNVAGERTSVSSLIPEGADPHSFEPTPSDVRRLAECRLVVINASGLVPTIDDLIGGAVGEGKPMVEAAAGLPGLEEDPHFWLDPVSVIHYVDNIADGLTDIDPGGADAYETNAARYSSELTDLDAWIRSQVETIPSSRRLLVTDHESLGRFAERYGFTVVGAIFPTTSGDGSPSARAVADLISEIERTGAPAIFLDAGANDDLAEQVSEASGAEVVTDLYTRSLGQEATTYLDMMRWNVTKIVEALK